MVRFILYLVTLHYAAAIPSVASDFKSDEELSPSLVESVRRKLSDGVVAIDDALRHAFGQTVRRALGGKRPGAAGGSSTKRYGGGGGNGGGGGGNGGGGGGNGGGGGGNGGGGGGNGGGGGGNGGSGGGNGGGGGGNGGSGGGNGGSGGGNGGSGGGNGGSGGGNGGSGGGNGGSGGVTTPSTGGGGGATTPSTGGGGSKDGGDGSGSADDSRNEAAVAAARQRSADNSSLSSGALVGLILACLTLIAVFILCFRRVNTRKKFAEDKYADTKQESAVAFPNASGSKLKSSQGKKQRSPPKGKSHNRE